MMTYRNSIGDISTPDYTSWLSLSDTDNWEMFQKYSMVLVVWLVWLANQFLCLIILLNFLIAVISQVYDNVVAEQKLVAYIHRAELNKEYYMIERFLCKLKEFKVLVFSIDKELQEKEDDENVGFVQSIKNYIHK